LIRSRRTLERLDLLGQCLALPAQIRQFPSHDLDLDVVVVPEELDEPTLALPQGRYLCLQALEFGGVDFALGQFSLFPEHDLGGREHPADLGPDAVLQRLGGYVPSRALAPRGSVINVSTAVVVIRLALVPEALADHRTQAERAAQPSAKDVVAVCDWSSHGARWVVQNLLHPLPEREVDDRGCRLGNLNPLLDRLLDDSRPATSAGDPHRHALRAPVHRAADVGVVHEDAANGDGIPPAPGKGGDPGIV
jgi:hypothetical protein